MNGSWKEEMLKAGVLCCCCSVTMSNSSPPHGLHHTRLSHPSQSPRVCSNPHPLSQWYHPTISSSVVPFSSCPQSFPTSGSSPMSQFLASGGQSIGASASASVLSMNIQGWVPWGFTGLISLQSKGLSRVFSSTTVWKHQFFGTQLSSLGSRYPQFLLVPLLTEACAGLALPVMGWEWLPDSGVQTWKTHLPRDTRHASPNRLLYLPSALPLCLISQLIQTQEERGY